MGTIGTECYDQGPHFSFSLPVPQPPHVPPVPQPPHMHTHVPTPVHMPPQLQPQDIPLPPSSPMSVDRPDYSDPPHHVPLPLALPVPAIPDDDWPVTRPATPAGSPGAHALIPRPASPTALTSAARGQHLKALQGQLADLFGVPLPLHPPPRTSTGMDADAPSPDWLSRWRDQATQYAESSYRRIQSQELPPAPSIPASRPRSPVPEEPHRGFVKGQNTGDYKDPSHPAYLVQQWRHVPAEDRPPVRATVNRERCAAHLFSNSPPLHTLPPSDVQSPQSPQLEDIPEEDIAEPPRGHHPPPVMLGALSPTEDLFIDPQSPQPDDSPPILS